MRATARSTSGKSSSPCGTPGEEGVVDGHQREGKREDYDTRVQYLDAAAMDGQMWSCDRDASEPGSVPNICNTNQDTSDFKSNA